MKITKLISNASIEDCLRDLYELQSVNTEIDNIQKLKGELPMEVRDLEDEIAGLDTRLDKLKEEIKELEQKISRFNAQIKESEMHIQRYESQQENVKNNREFEALAREVELQKLDIQLAQKRIKETQTAIANKQITIDATAKKKDGKLKDLDRKQDELKKIIAKTEKEEKTLAKKEAKVRKNIDDRILRGYDRIRTAYRNGLAIVMVEREACGGCHNYVPPQLQAEIRQRKRLISCEHCGRILYDVDESLPREFVERESGTNIAPEWSDDDYLE